MAKDKEALEIKEIIVVEGRDDTNAIKRAVGAVTIETHGFGISEETWAKLDNAYKERGLIIFTDPDYAGNLIRKKLKEKYPEAKEAFLARKKAMDKNLDHPDIGIENANPEDIREALSKAHATYYSDDIHNDKSPENKVNWSPYTLNDLEKYGLIGAEDSSK